MRPVMRLVADLIQCSSCELSFPLLHSISAMFCASETSRSVPMRTSASGLNRALCSSLGAARAIGFDQMAVRRMANGGESRDIAHGTLATGETVNVHQSMQVVGSAPNPAHVIQHTEFILVREGELEFQHEVAGQMVSERVGPGGVIYVAFGTRHAVKNVGGVPARYFVVAIGGETKQDVPS